MKHVVALFIFRVDLRVQPYGVSTSLHYSTPWLQSTQRTCWRLLNAQCAPSEQRDIHGGICSGNQPGSSLGYIASVRQATISRPNVSTNIISLCGGCLQWGGSFAYETCNMLFLISFLYMSIFPLSTCDPTVKGRRHRIWISCVIWLWVLPFSARDSFRTELFKCLY